MRATLSRPLVIPAADRASSRWLSKLFCTVWGHQVDNHRFRRGTWRDRRCGCGESYLAEDGSHTHVRHTLSCFVGHHTYTKLIDRDAHHEYVCVQCGHPLLFAEGHDPYAASALFQKKVRYLCGLFGHRVHHVTDRNGFSEYACHCGHTFLKAQGHMSHITHPLVCVASGHRIRYVESRGGWAEYVCQDCGHPFCFAATEVA